MTYLLLFLVNVFILCFASCEENYESNVSLSHSVSRDISDIIRYDPPSDHKVRDSKITLSLHLFVCGPIPEGLSLSILCCFKNSDGFGGNVLIDFCEGFRLGGGFDFCGDIISSVTGPPIGRLDSRSLSLSFSWYYKITQKWVSIDPEFDCGRCVELKYFGPWIKPINRGFFEFSNTGYRTWNGTFIFRAWISFIRSYGRFHRFNRSKSDYINYAVPTVFWTVLVLV